ncbi:MAG TPA: DUF1801 domain-containing protein [Casimicrobiaceae bacterium]|nr:DUF1801 domain-containing protein [Casimicrobiaceae bacterium]
MAASRVPASIDAYIAGFRPEVRAILEEIRATVRPVAPDASEAISYGIPAFKLDGALVYFAGFKQHIGFYPPVRGNAKLEKAVARYANDKGNLRFPLDEPMPLALIRRIVRHRLRQNRAAANAAAMAPRRSRP